jgi:lipoteichoic acid synthase
LDVVAGQLGLKCARHGSASGTQNRFLPDTADDTCLVTAFDQWVREAPSARFFAVLWTLQTHYPYFSSGTQRQFGAKARGLNRYLNALHQSDQVFGQLMRSLEDRGLLASTLVVVVGDHGEAFGQHGRRVHGELLYEEDLRIPLLLVNPRLFGGEVDSVVSGMKDVAPTVLDLLGYPTPREWQGRSLIRDGRSDRTYFFSLRSDFRFGYRDGRPKLLFNATENKAELYDLAADPRESANLAPQHPALVQEGVQHLADWIRSHDRFLNDRYAEPAQQQGAMPPRR